MPTRYVVAACRNSQSANEPDFPVHVLVLEASSRLDALRQAKTDFEANDAAAARVKNWTHLRIVDEGE